MKILVILTDPPYGNENVYNGLRLCLALKKAKADVHLRVFLLGDAVVGALTKQDTPKGYYNIERMLSLLLRQEALIKACGTCLRTRGISEASLITGIQPSSMAELAAWTLWADKVISL